MTLSQGFTQNQIRQFNDGVVGFLLADPTLYNYMEANGVKTSLPKGQDRFTYLKAESIKGGKLTSSIHDYNTVAVRWAETTTGLDYLVSRLMISRQDIDRYSSGSWVRGDLVQETLQQVLPTMVNQMDQLLAWGDEFQADVELDTFVDSGEITGIFNGGTAVNAGPDGANDMQDAGDFLYAIATMRKALRNAHHNQDQYMIFSDLDTQIYSEIENQFYSTVGVTEYQRILEKKYIKGWLDSPNFIDDTGVKYRMAMLAPTQKNKPIGAKGPNGNFELFMAYDFDVHFDAGGQTIGNYVIGYVTCSFKLVEYRSTAIQRSGTLTLT